MRFFWDSQVYLVDDILTEFFFQNLSNFLWLECFQYALLWFLNVMFRLLYYNCMKHIFEYNNIHVGIHLLKSSQKYSADDTLL